MINFDSMVDNYIAREHKPKNIGRYYPSEIGSCIRKVWYSYKHPHEVSTDLAKVFELGNIMHDFVAKVLRSEKNPHVELVEEELPFKMENKDFTVSGRIDDVILIKEDGRKVLVEVKSAKSINFVNSPSKAYIMQLQLYMHHMGIHEGIILYVDKTNLKSRHFNIKYDKKLAEEIMKRFFELHICLITDKLPEPEAKGDNEMSWMCRYCDYADMCAQNMK